MEEVVRQAVQVLVTITEGIGAIVIFTGVLVSFGLWVGKELHFHRASYEQVRLRLGRFLALGLEFQLASDILSTAVSPSFEEIGKLGAIATIRTVLNTFLRKELELERERASRAGTDAPA